MGFGEWRHRRLALRQLWRNSDCSRQLQGRLRAVICLVLYMHNFWASGVADDAVVLSHCTGTEQCVGESP